MLGTEVLVLEVLGSESNKPPSGLATAVFRHRAVILLLLVHSLLLLPPFVRVRRLVLIMLCNT